LETIFGDVDLTGVVGLEECRHLGASIIDQAEAAIALAMAATAPERQAVMRNVIDRALTDLSRCAVTVEPAQ
jgi:hypothetical protein